MLKSGETVCSYDCNRASKGEVKVKLPSYITFHQNYDISVSKATDCGLDCQGLISVKRSWDFF